MRSLLLAGACAASMMMALTPAAQAADIDVAPEPMGWSWYVSVFGGWSNPKYQEIESFDSDDPLYVDSEFDLDNGFMAGVAVGAYVNEWLRGELEVSGHWHDLEGYDAQYDNDHDGEETALFALANLWLEVPIGAGPFRPYVGGGVGFGRIDLDVDAADTAFIDDSDWGFAYQLGAGVAFGFTENMAIDVGYRFKAINDADLEISDDWTGSDSFEVEKDYRSHNILVGLRIGF